MHHGNSDPLAGTNGPNGSGRSGTGGPNGHERFVQASSPGFNWHIRTASRARRVQASSEESLPDVPEVHDDEGVPFLSRERLIAGDVVLQDSRGEAFGRDAASSRPRMFKYAPSNEKCAVCGCRWMAWKLRGCQEFEEGERVSRQVGLRTISLWCPACPRCGTEVLEEQRGRKRKAEVQSANSDGGYREEDSERCIRCRPCAYIDWTGTGLDAFEPGEGQVLRTSAGPTGEADTLAENQELFDREASAAASMVRSMDWNLDAYEDPTDVDPWTSKRWEDYTYPDD